MLDDAYRLSLSVKSADGRVKKWGPDEVDGRDIPSGLEFGSSIPGGHKDLSCSLLREFTRTNHDNNLFDEVRCYGPGNDSAFEGYFTEFPKQQGNSYTVEPGAVGWSACLSDAEDAREIYRDVDISRWQSLPSVQRQINASGNRYEASSSDFDTTTGGPSLVQRLQSPWSVNTVGTVESVYDAGPGGLLGSIYYAWTKSARVSEADTNWSWAVLASTDDVLTSTDSSGNLRAAGPGTGTLATTGSNKRFVVIQFVYNAANTSNDEFKLFWSDLAVYGNHGLTKRGTEPNVGFYNCDIVADIVRRWAPLLNYTTGPDGSIQDNAVSVPHFAFYDLVSAAEMIARASAFGFDPLILPEWGVYDNKQFFWRAPDPDRLCWQARLHDGAKPRMEGEQSDDIINGVVVQFTDPSGKTRVVGPPAERWSNGVALADATDSSLFDASPDNVVNAHGRPRKWDTLRLSSVTNDDTAIAMGAVYLAIRSQPQRRGQIELTGTVRHPTMTKPRPVWKVRAGDYIDITDSAEAGVKRRIIDARYTHDTRTCVATVDNTPFTLDALLELFAADLVGSII